MKRERERAPVLEAPVARATEAAPLRARRFRHLLLIST
jgi:hypothetical protein